MAADVAQVAGVVLGKCARWGLGKCARWGLSEGSVRDSMPGVWGFEDSSWETVIQSVGCEGWVFVLRHMRYSGLRRGRRSEVQGFVCVCRTPDRPLKKFTSIPLGPLLPKSRCYALHPSTSAFFFFRSSASHLLLERQLFKHFMFFWRTTWLPIYNSRRSGSQGGGCETMRMFLFEKQQKVMLANIRIGKETCLCLIFVPASNVSNLT